MQHLREVVGDAGKEVKKPEPQKENSAPRVVETPNASTRIIEKADGERVTLERLHG